MPNQLSNQMLAQIFAQESNDPFLLLVTLEHESLAAPIRLVANTESVTSRGNLFEAFPMKLRLAVDDGESDKQVSIEFDNVGLTLIDALRSITDPLKAKLELVLASLPNTVQIVIEDLKMSAVTYSRQSVQATLYFDSFMTTEMTSERYTPSKYPSLF